MNILCEEGPLYLSGSKNDYKLTAPNNPELYLIYAKKAIRRLKLAERVFTNIGALVLLYYFLDELIKSNETYNKLEVVELYGQVIKHMDTKFMLINACYPSASKGQTAIQDMHISHLTNTIYKQMKEQDCNIELFMLIEELINRNEEK